MFFLHGIGKVAVVGLSTVNASFISHGFPTWTNYAATFIEIVAGLTLVAGFHSRISALVLIPVALGITAYHFPNGWVFSNPDGGWEYPFLILVVLAAIFFLGGGKYALIKNR